jgi:hypothetical protein
MRSESADGTASSPADMAVAAVRFDGIHHV